MRIYDTLERGSPDLVRASTLTSILKLQRVDLFTTGVAKDHDAVIGSEAKPATQMK